MAAAWAELPANKHSSLQIQDSQHMHQCCRCLCLSLHNLLHINNTRLFGWNSGYGLLQDLIDAPDLSVAKARRQDINTVRMTFQNVRDRDQRFTQQQASLLSNRIPQVLQDGVFRDMSRAVARQLQLLASAWQTTQQALELDVDGGVMLLCATLTTCVKIWLDASAKADQESVARQQILQRLSDAGEHIQLHMLTLSDSGS